MRKNKAHVVLLTFTSGEMDDAHCAVCCVDTLAPGTSRSECVDAKVLRINVDVKLRKQSGTQTGINPFFFHHVNKQRMR